MKKKYFAHFVLTLAVVIITGIIGAGGNQKLSRMTNADGNEYSISFNSTNNKFSSSSGTQIINTEHGNPISFSYSGYSGALGKWGNIATDGYIANDTALSGLINLSVIYGNATAIGDLIVSYGWWNSSSNSIVYEVTDGLITSTSTTFNFDGYSPSFFKISASSTAQITSMTLTYSCEASEDPIAAFNGLVFTLSDSEYSVTYCDGSVTSIIIPSIYKGLPVTSIGDFAFYNCTSLTSITIPSSVTSIGDYAFSYCTSLTSVSIPSSVTSIGDSAFSYCTSLTSVSIPSSVTSIGDYAFSYCISLTSVSIPSSVTSIGERAFSYCTSLTSISVDSNNEAYSSIDGTLFDKGVKTLISWPGGKAVVIFPPSVTSIGNGAFSGFESLTSITIPSSVTSIGGGAFSGCSSLTSIVIPDSVTSIGDSAFSYCTSLTSVSIPSSVTSIGDYAFSYCTSLTSVSIPSSVTSIGDSAFYYCTSLTSIVIPNSVTTIGDWAFYNCTSLTIYAEASSKPSGWNSYWNFSNRPVVWGYVG